MIEHIIRADDPSRKWPAKDFLQAFGFPTLLVTALTRDGLACADEISLKDLFELAVSDTIQDPRRGYVVSPMLSYHCIGKGHPDGMQLGRRRGWGRRGSYL